MTLTQQSNKLSHPLNQQSNKLSQQQSILYDHFFKPTRFKS